MHTKIGNNNMFEISEMMQEEMNAEESGEPLFNLLDKKLLDRKEIFLSFNKITFISVYCLERLAQFVTRAKDLNVKVKIVNLSPAICKVFYVARVKNILEVCE